MMLHSGASTGGKKSGCVTADGGVSSKKASPEKELLPIVNANRAIRLAILDLSKAGVHPPGRIAEKRAPTARPNVYPCCCHFSELWRKPTLNAKPVKQWQTFFVGRPDFSAHGRCGYGAQAVRRAKEFENRKKR